MLKIDRFNGRKCALDRGSIISNVIKIEKSNNAQFAHKNSKTKQDSEIIEDSDSKKLVLICEHESKEEIIKCEKEHKNDSICARSIIGLKHRNRYYERKIS